MEKISDEVGRLTLELVDGFRRAGDFKAALDICKIGLSSKLKKSIAEALRYEKFLASQSDAKKYDLNEILKNRTNHTRK